jgi:hypothetical protein
MAKQVLKILLFFIVLLLFNQCAQVAPLNGGKRDLNPPKLIEALPSNLSTNFNGDVVILKFDEFIQLKDLSNQLIISPKLKTMPQLEADGKKIKISFKKDDLLPNTTYRFYLGQAIADMHEGNALKNFEYIFSTGNVIDTLKVKGIALDAFNNKPLANALVGLYNNELLKDSLPYSVIPNYICKSNDNGEFAFSYLPRTTFKAYAYDDKNKNSLYDGDIEKIAFSSNDLTLTSDSSLKFYLFREEPSKTYIKKTITPYAGLAQIIFNKKTRKHIIPLNSNEINNLYETDVNKEKDTISIYYKNISDTLNLKLIDIATKKTDTLKIPLPKKNVSAKKVIGYTINVINGYLPLNAKLTLSFLNWMDTTQTNLSKIKLLSKDDSIVSLSAIKGHWLTLNIFEFNNELKEGKNYTLNLDTNAFFNTNSNTNDSSRINFKTQSKLEFGKVTLKLLFNKKQPYIIQLINDKEQVIRESFASFSLSSSNAVSMDFTDVTPGIYFVKIIFDANDNKKWDTGNLYLKQQPERVIIHSKQIKVLSDWEIEEEILIKE